MIIWSFFFYSAEYTIGDGSFGSVYKAKYRDKVGWSLHLICQLMKRNERGKFAENQRSNVIINV